MPNRGDRRFMHAERVLSITQALARVPADAATLTVEQFQYAVGLTDPLPIRKWIHQRRIGTYGPAAIYRREDVVRFLSNRFSPYSLLEARLFRTGVSLLVKAGATARADVDVPKLHAIIDELLDHLGAGAFGAIMRRNQSGLAFRLTTRAPDERAVLRAGLMLVAVTGATGDLGSDRQRLHAALDTFIAGFGGSGGFEWAVRDRAQQLGISLVRPRRRRVR